MTQEDNKVLQNERTPDIIKSTNDSCNSWMNTAHKSPMPCFDTSAFNIIASPWKLDSL